MVIIKKSLIFILLLSSLLFSVLQVAADENTNNVTNESVLSSYSDNSSLKSNTSENKSLQMDQQNQSNSTIVTNAATMDNSSDMAGNVIAVINSTPNNFTQYKNTTNETQNITIQQDEIISSLNISLLKVFPDYIKLGDAQLNLQIENSGITELRNIDAQLTGIGFSTYEVNEIESLKSKEKGYILVMGSFKKTGNISLKIKIKEFIFYSNITIYDPFYVAIDVEKETKLEEDKKKKINELSLKIDALQKQYQQLEKQFDEKKNDDYEISGISLQDLKTYIRNTQASLAVADEKDSHGNYVLAENEYNYQKEKIAGLQKIKRSLKQAIVDNAVLISTIVGGLVAMITLVEIVRRQKERVSEKFKNIQLKKENK